MVSAPRAHIAAALTTAVIATAARRGADGAAAWHAAGFAVPPALDARIADDAHLTIWEALMRDLGDPGLPIHYASAMHIDDYGVLGLACKTAASLDEAILRVVRYVGIVAEAVQCERHRDARGARLEVRRRGRAGLGKRVATESILAEITMAIRQIAGPDAVLGVEHRHAAPSDVTAHETFYGSPVGFGRRRNALLLDPATLDRPLPRSDEGLSSYLAERLEEAAPAATWTSRIEQAIEHRLPSGVPALAEVARALGTSARSLQRHLEDEATTWRDQVTEVRRRRGEQLVADPTLPLGEVAFLLGFSAPSSFHRAFKRWTGRTPAAFRQRR
jgi:AraC-like DNA-binding protein